MTEEPENVVLQYLRRLDVKLDRLTEGQAGLTERVDSVEAQVGGLRREFSYLR